MYNYSAKLFDSSRRLADILTQEIGYSQEKFDELMTVAYSDEYPLSMRAARIAYMCGCNYPFLFIPHIPRILNVLPHLKTEGVIRGFLKTFAELQLPLNDEDQGYLADMAFELANDVKKPIALRVYSLDILMKLCEQYPDLIPELLAIIDNFEINGSAALAVKRRRILKKIKIKGYE